jgi:hypothetical protein
VPSLTAIPVEPCPWALATQVRDLSACAIGLAPLPDNRFTRGKCGFKIFQYFAAGLPVVASPVGVNRSLIERSGAGLLAETPQQWRAAVETLLADPARRRQMGDKGRQFVRPTTRRSWPSGSAPWSPRRSAERPPLTRPMATVDLPGRQCPRANAARGVGHRPRSAGTGIFN